MSRRDEKMKCPYGDVKTDYRSPLGFIKHMKKKHSVEEKIGMQLYAEVLKMCPHCYAVIPSSCVGCPNCAHIFDERLIKLYEEHKTRI